MVPLVELVDASTGSSLLALTVGDTTSTGLSYGGAVLEDFGVQLVAEYSAAYTSFNINVYTMQVTTVASSSPYWIASYPISGAVDTTGSIYELYLSSTVNGATGGTFRNIVISGKPHFNLLQFFSSRVISSLYCSSNYESDDQAHDNTDHQAFCCSFGEPQHSLSNCDAD
jgi:hypothetical protein